MNSSYISRLKVWFEDYIERFSSNDTIVQENVDLKAEHTRRVCEAILDIGGSLGLGAEDLCIAEVSALLHDIGRFEQYRRYRTFADHKSEDHAALGVRVIKAEGVLRDVDPAGAEIVIRAVECHNRAVLPAGETERSLFFIKLLRDADKVDILRVVTEYYRNAANGRNRTIELDLPEGDGVSDSVFEALINGRLVRMADLKTLNDFKLLQIGWIYDMNFPRTFQIVRDKKYLEKIREVLPGDSARIAEIYQLACEHLDRHFSPGCTSPARGCEELRNR
ncbi:MAG TPA: HD domain-containing protein [Desulfobacteraceae bacterium]|nr:HD domain-containing protein [Desulfobacteraceae bacterium]